MKRISSLAFHLSSLKLTAALLVAFLVLIFWGVLAQAQGGDASAGDRFFKSYFIWIAGVVPLPAFKSLAVLGCVNVVASMAFRMPRGLKNAGLWLIHAALLLLMAGGVAESELRTEFSGYRMVPVSVAGESSQDSLQGEVVFFTVDDSLRVTPVDVPENSFAYTVHYRGRVAGVMGATVDMYTATYDPLRFVPYAFMVLFLLGAGFHYLVKVRKKKNSLKILPLSVLLALTLPMKAQSSEEEAIFWVAINSDAPVWVDGTVQPFNSFAREFLDDLSGRVTFKSKESVLCRKTCDAEFIVGCIEHDSETADSLPLFKVLRSDVSEALRLPPKRTVSYAQLLQSRDLLQLYASRTDNLPATVEMRRLYSNVLQYEALQRGEAYSVIERNSPLHSSVDTRRLSLEVVYHRLNLALCGFVLAMISCIVAGVNVFFRSRRTDVVANLFCALGAAVLFALFALRAYIAMRPPMSSLYEIVLLVALILLLFETVAFFFCKKRTYTLMVPVTALAAVLLFLAKFILEPGNTFQQIPAVLNSSAFLTVHVFTIALGFAGMILSGVVAHLVLIRSLRDKDVLPSPENPKGAPLYALLYGTLVFGAVFTIIGTLLGGVWADFAWGRFWGFDPKECGALFVIVWAMLILHLKAGRLISPRGFALMSSFNVIVTFLCWFGINLLGVGLHSYGFQSGSVAWLAAFTLADASAIIAIFLLCRFLPKAI